MLYFGWKLILKTRRTSFRLYPGFPPSLDQIDINWESGLGFLTLFRHRLNIIKFYATNMNLEGLMENWRIVSTVLDRAFAFRLRTRGNAGTARIDKIFWMCIHVCIAIYLHSNSVDKERERERSEKANLIEGHFHLCVEWMIRTEILLQHRPAGFQHEK